jgi:hypothetical protein
MFPKDAMTCGWAVILRYPGFRQKLEVSDAVVLACELTKYSRGKNMFAVHIVLMTASLMEFQFFIHLRPFWMLSWKISCC